MDMARNVLPELPLMKHSGKSLHRSRIITTTDVGAGALTRPAERMLRDDVGERHSAAGNTSGAKTAPDARVGAPGPTWTLLGRSVGISTTKHGGKSAPESDHHHDSRRGGCPFDFAQGRLSPARRSECSATTLGTCTQPTGSLPAQEPRRTPG